MFDYIGKSIEINYDNGNNYRIDYLSDNELKWTNLDKPKESEKNHYCINEQAMGIFTIIWIEKSGLQVCQNIDFNDKQVYAVLTWDNKKNLVIVKSLFKKACLISYKMKLDQVEIDNYYLTILSPESPKQKYPVIYVQDGKSILDNETMLKRITNNQLDHFIIVGITSSNRNDDYTPWPSNIYQEKYLGLGDNYLKVLVNDIKPYIDQHYATDPDYDNTGIVGASLGGLISMYASVQYPNTFRYVGCISPSFWYENFVAFILKQTNLNQDTSYHFTIGSNENKSFVAGGITSIEAFNHIINYLIKYSDNIYSEISDQYFHKTNSFQDRFILYLKYVSKEMKRNKK